MIPRHEDFNFGTGDFTIEMWIKPNSTATNDPIFHSLTGGSGTNDGYHMGFDSAEKVRFYSLVGGSAVGLVLGPISAWGESPLWKHIILQRKNNNHVIFQDGVPGPAFVYANTRNMTTATSNNVFTIGNDQEGGYG